MEEIKYDQNIKPLDSTRTYPRPKDHKVKPLKVIVICAHPDDADLLTGGLTIKLRERGHKVKYVAVTNGNLGHHIKTPNEIAEIRLKEAQDSAKILGAEYECLNINDGMVFVNQENTEKIVKVIREYDPDLVITHRPYDYHRDHRYTGQLVMDASYMLIVPHYCPGTPISTSRKMPIIAYAYDNFKKPYSFKPDVILDISDVYEEKANGLISHESQMMEWIPWTQKIEGSIPPDYDIKKKKEIVEVIHTFTFPNALTDYRSLIKNGYPDKKVTKIEAFEICEYGRQPNKMELKELFPGAIFPKKKDLSENLN